MIYSRHACKLLTMGLVALTGCGGGDNSEQVAAAEELENGDGDTLDAPNESSDSEVSPDSSGNAEAETEFQEPGSTDEPRGIANEPMTGADEPAVSDDDSATEDDPPHSASDTAEPEADDTQADDTQAEVPEEVLEADLPGVEPDEPGAEAEISAETGFPAESACLEGIEGFDEDGPFEVEDDSSGRVNIWVPDIPAGCQVPVIHLANGTGARCSVYGSILRRFASHGFIASCYEDTNTGAGTQGVEALETVLESHADIAAMRIGSMGHSQGGQAAFTVLEQAESRWGDDAVYAGLAMQPASGYGDQPPNGSWEDVYGRVSSPMFMFSGTLDILVSERWVSTGFSALDGNVEAYHWSAIGSTHIPTPNAETEQVGVPWFRWKLLNDENACQAFKDLRDTQRWEVVQQQNETTCQR